MVGTLSRCPPYDFLHLSKRSVAVQAGTRPPKNGIRAWLSVCGRVEV
jgi:hypothetical protein